MATTSNNDIAYAIYSIFKGKKKEEFPDLSKKVIKFLDRRRLISKSPDILKRLDGIINEEDNKVVVKILSARKVSEKLKKELKVLLEKRYQAKEIVFLEKLDEKLLGGVRLEIKDEVIDLTIKNKIKNLQEYLTKNYESR